MFWDFGSTKILCFPRKRCCIPKKAFCIPKRFLPQKKVSGIPKNFLYNKHHLRGTLCPPKTILYHPKSGTPETVGRAPRNASALQSNFPFLTENESSYLHKFPSESAAGDFFSNSTSRIIFKTLTFLLGRWRICLLPCPADHFRPPQTWWKDWGILNCSDPTSTIWIRRHAPPEGTPIPTRPNPSSLVESADSPTG